MNGRKVRRACVYEWYGEATADEPWTFLLGGRGELRYSGHGLTRGRGSMACDASQTRDTPYDFDDKGKPQPFSWQVRGK